MELHLLRHGQTNWNEERRAQGQSDSVLTELGIQQAKDLGQRIQALEFDTLLCSSSVRTRQTAEHAFSARPDLYASIDYLDSFREIHMGPWEGILYDDIEKTDPQSFAHFWQEPHLFDVAGAESFYDLQKRAIDQIHALVAENFGKKVAVVSHGALIKTVLCHALERPLDQLWAPPNMHNCAHSIIHYAKDLSPTVTQIADAPHS